MSKIIDDLGYRIKIPNEEFLAITLVDNGVDPYKKMKKTTLEFKYTWKHNVEVSCGNYGCQACKYFYEKPPHTRRQLHWFVMN